MKIKVIAVMISMTTYACVSESSSSKEQSIQTKADITLPYTQILSEDSISLGIESGYVFYNIPEINPDLYLDNKQFVVSSKDLVVGLIDSTGAFISKITQKGNGPGELQAARSVKAWTGEDGDIYVLTNANIFSLHVYNGEGTHKYTTRLFREIEGVFHPRDGFYYMSAKVAGKYTLSLGVGSTRYSSFTPDYYHDTKAIAQFTIDDHTGKVIATSQKLPLSDFPEVREALKAQTISWGTLHAIFRFHDEKFYLTFPFSKLVYIYDKDFDLIKTIQPNTLQDYSAGFNYKMQPTPRDLYKRTYFEHRAYLENLSIRNLQILDNRLIIQYQPPLQESDYLSRIPTEKDVNTKGNWHEFAIEVDQMWLVLNLKNGNEQLLRLPPGHNMGVLLDHRRMLLQKEDANSEERFIYKYTFKNAIH